MKKIQILLIVLSMAFATACRHRNHTIIRTSDGFDEVKIEYSGRVVFNADSSIGYMEPKAFLKYKDNDQTLEVTCNRDGKVMYELNDEAPTKTLDTNGKQLLSEAVKQILKAKGKKARRS